ncbi:MAG: DUF2235 domain-containing protein [Magnetospirillum sp. WYHS-4]
MSKNIVVLSDGTGNSAAKAVGTNVRRIYRALDLCSATKQVVFYDDGVGSGDSKFSKIFGGAFGFGLKRNVLELYQRLSQCYDPDDRIYMFGFSRGAYTIRVLVGLIDCCGLIPGAAGKAPEELESAAKDAYRVFRKKFKYFWQSKTATQDACAGTRPPIAFLGLWDTVDAYGFPVDELADFWNATVYPYRFKDRDLTPLVGKACHALALDDERHTFHPVLWNDDKKDPNRIEQVWFAGAHSNVGGGYPDDSLSLISLDWMMIRAQEAGLFFIDSEWRVIREQANALGKLYNSRSGGGVYYRYKPRNVADLCNDGETGVHIARPKIHSSVFERVGGGVGYRPLGLPDVYDIVDTQPCAADVPAKVVLKPGPWAADDPTCRVKEMEHAWDWVFLRRALYIGFVLASIALFLVPWWTDWVPGASCKTSTCDLVTPLFGLLAALLPDMLARWLEALRQNPPALWSFVAIFWAFYVVRSKWLAKTQVAANLAWLPTGHPAKRQSQPPALTRMMRELVRSTPARTALRLFWWVIGAALVGILFYMLVVAASRGVFLARDMMGLCTETERVVELAAQPASRKFSVGESCFATGIKVLAGQHVQISVATEPLQEVWLDGATRAGPDGFLNPKAEKDFHFVSAGPFRRLWSESWFRVLAQIGNSGTSRFAVGSGTGFVAPKDGELFLFVNDAVFGILPEWDVAYRWPKGRNQGTAMVTVSLAP